VLTRTRDVRLLAVLAVAVIWTAALTAAHLAPVTPVAVAAVVDLSLTSAVALYIIAVRRRHLPRWTIPITVAAGLAVGRNVLGDRADAGELVFATALGIELVMFAITIAGARRAIRSWRTTRGASRVDRVDAALTAVGMPAGLARVVATEVTLVTYAITGWRQPVTSPPRFTVHRVNGWALFAGVIIFLTLVETVVVHIALAAFVSPLAAWIATGLSLYSVLWLAGDAHALRHSGVTVTAAGLELAIGVRWSGTLPWPSIVSIGPGTIPDRRASGVVDASVLGANVVVALSHPVELVGPFGRRKRATRVGLSIDDSTALLSMCRAAGIS
jgi:hypothetical protein